MLVIHHAAVPVIICGLSTASSTKALIKDSLVNLLLNHAQFRATCVRDRLELPVLRHLLDEARVVSTCLLPCSSRLAMLLAILTSVIHAFTKVS